LNLTGRQRQDTYVLGCLDQQAAVVFRYRIINLVVTPGGEILERGPLGLIPLVPLMMHDRPLEAVFDECLRRVREAPEDKLPTLELILAVLASRRQDNEKAFYGEAYEDHGLVFCQENGKPIHPETSPGTSTSCWRRPASGISPSMAPGTPTPRNCWRPA